MRLLITNDDGIHALGLSVLATAAATLGEVWVVAPGGQPPPGPCTVIQWEK